MRSTSTVPKTLVSMSCVTYPGRRIVGVSSVRSMIVDSSPIPTSPPSMIISTRPSRSSLQYLAIVGDGLPERLADGAAIYPPSARIKAWAILLLGKRTATVSSPPVVSYGTSSLLRKIIVSGPGQKASASLLACGGKSSTIRGISSSRHTCTISGLSDGRPFAA